MLMYEPAFNANAIEETDIEVEPHGEFDMIDESEDPRRQKPSSGKRSSSLHDSIEFPEKRTEDSKAAAGRLIEAEKQQYGALKGAYIVGIFGSRLCFLLVFGLTCNLNPVVQYFGQAMHAHSENLVNAELCAT